MVYLISAIGTNLLRILPYLDKEYNNIDWELQHLTMSYYKQYVRHSWALSDPTGIEWIKFVPLIMSDNVLRE